MTEGALAGIRVLELGTYVSTPYCGKLFADYGADVIKVEPPGAGDPARHAGPFPNDVPHPEKSGLFLHCNTSKRGVTLDLATATGRGLLLRLAETADIVLENFAPGTLASYGLGYDELRARNPRIVLTSVTPYGQTGPYANLPGGELLEFALSTRMAVHGDGEREPLRYGPDVGQFQAGITAAAATIGALWGALEQGEGTHIDISIVEAMMGNVDSRISMFLYDGTTTPRAVDTPGGYPMGAYPCADGFVIFASMGDRFFRRACRAIGHPELLDDPRWADPTQRPLHQDDFDVMFLPWLLERTRQQVFEDAQAFGVMCAPILSVREAMADPQSLARGFFVEAGHPVAGTLTYPGAPFIMTEGGFELRRPAPALGQHNTEVLCDELGLERAELVKLAELGIV